MSERKNPWGEILAAMRQFAAAHNLLCEERNWRAPEYQICKMSGEGVCLIVYPHTTKGTGGFHARIREENSKDKARADELMGATGLWIKNRGAWTGKLT